MEMEDDEELEPVFYDSIEMYQEEVK